MTKKDLSEKQLIDVIENGDDNLTNMLVVDRQGNFSLFSYEKHTDNTDVFSYDYAVFNAESFQPHNGYVGVNASKDNMFVRNEYTRMNNAWHEYLETGKKQQSSDFYRSPDNK